MLVMQPKKGVNWDFKLKLNKSHNNSIYFLNEIKHNKFIWEHTIVATIIMHIIKLTQLFNSKSTPLKDWNWPP